MKANLSFNGTGGELFGKLFVGMLLTMITFGIYMPWFIVGMNKYFYSKTVIQGTPKGDVNLEFSGTGGGLFVKWLVGMLLSGITAGIYAPWFICDMTRFWTDHSRGKTSDGMTYQLRFVGGGGSLFGVMIVGWILTMITLGIYMPWLMCKVNNWFCENTEILEQGSPVGRFSFTGTGGALIGKWLVGFFLTMITGGIYGAWFQVTMMKFMTEETRITFKGQTLQSHFEGTGGQLFVIMLVGMLLMPITLGIYTFWFITKQMKWQLESTSFTLTNA